MTVKLKALAYSRDNGDGSQSVVLFNNEEELEKYLADGYDSVTLEQIKSGDDPYECGEIEEIEIDLELEQSTQGWKLTLTKPFSVSFG